MNVNTDLCFFSQSSRPNTQRQEQKYGKTERQKIKNKDRKRKNMFSSQCIPTRIIQNLTQATEIAARSNWSAPEKNVEA